MNIVFEIGHPAHVHLFKHVIWALQKKGHSIQIIARKKDINLYLLDFYGFEYQLIGENRKQLHRKAIGHFRSIISTLGIVRRFKADVLVSTGSPSLSQVGKLTGTPHLSWSDTEHADLLLKLLLPFTTIIATPSCFMRKLGKNHIYYNGYHELAYIHPNYFEPDETVKELLGLEKDERFAIVRFVSWTASHDIGETGLPDEAMVKIIKDLSEYVKVYVSSEMPMRDDIECYKLDLPPERIHDALSFCSLYFGDGGTTTTEAALLGIADVLMGCLAYLCGIHNELRSKYGLQYFYDGWEEALEKAMELLRSENIDSKWMDKRDTIMSEKIDTTEFIVSFIERYGG